MQDFEGTRIMITGGSRGIGEAIARHFVEAGARVAIVARDQERAESTAAELGGETRAFAADVSEENAVNETVGAIVDAWDGLDVLINNAGITRDNLLMRMKVEDWEAVMSTNLRSVFLCSRAVLRPMIKQRAGRIINITSVIGLMGNAGQGNYAASKAGIIGFTKSLARELAGRSITVNAIAPGLIDTDMTRAMGDDAREKVLAQIPLGRFGSGEDIAGAASYLASAAGSYVTGEVIRVDGGMAI